MTAAPRGRLPLRLLWQPGLGHAPSVCPALRTVTGVWSVTRHECTEDVWCTEPVYGTGVRIVSKKVVTVNIATPSATPAMSERTRGGVLWVDLLAPVSLSTLSM